MMTGLSFDIFARDKASPAFDKVSRSVEKTEKKFGFLAARTGGLTAGMTAGFGKVAGAMAAIGAAGFLKGAITEASDLGETISKSAAVFGPANADILKFGKNAATSLGQTQQQAIAAASQFGNMFNQLGIGQKPAAQMSKQMVTLASDFASFHNADITEVLQAQEAAFRGEYDSVQRFVPTINAAAVEQEGLRLGLAASTKELDAQDKAIATQSLLMKGAGKAVGDFARTSGGLANQQRILSAQFGDFKASLGQIALPLVTKFVTFINDRGIPALKTIKNGVEGLGAAFRGEGVTSDGFVGAMERIGVKARSAFGVFQTVAIPHLKDFGGFVKNNLVPQLGSFLGFITKWPGKVIAGLTTGFNSGNWGPLGKSIGDGFITALKGISGTIDKIGAAVGDLFDKIDWGMLGGKITGAVRGMLASVDWKGLGETLGDSVITIFQRATTLGDKVGKSFKDLMDKVDWKNIGRDSTKSIGNFIAGIDWAQLSKTLGLAALKSLKFNFVVFNTVTQSAADLIMGIAEEIGRAIGRWFSGAGRWLEGKGKELVSGLKSGASSEAKGFGTWISQRVIAPVVAPFKNAGKWLVGHGRELITGLKAGVWEFAQGLDDWMTRAPVAKLIAPWHGAAKWLTGPGKNVITGLIRGVGDAAKNIGNWVGRNVISPTVGMFTKAGSWLVQNGKNLVAGLQNGIVSIAKGIGGWVSRNVISPTVSVFTRAGTWLVNHGKNLVAGFKNGITTIAGTIGRWAYDNVIVPVVKPFAAAGKWLTTEGANLIAGMKNGVIGQMKTIGSWIKTHVVDPIVGAVKTFFGIRSPSKVFEGIGGHLIGGLMKGLGSGRGSAIAKKVFGDMPGALRAVVGKGLVNLSSLPQKALDALGFGADFTVPGVIPGALSGPNRRVFYQGEALDFGTYSKLAKAMKMVGGVNVTQGSYERASSFSGSTHTGGGVFDVVGGNLTRIMSGLKASGLIGWIRNPSQGPWPWHIHALDPGETGRMSASARAQVADYYRGGNGLAGYKQGTPWVPDDQWARLHKGEAVLPRDVNEARIAAGRNGGGSTVVLEFRSDGSPHMDWLIREFRKYVKVNGGNVQQALGTR